MATTKEVCFKFFMRVKGQKLFEGKNCLKMDV